MNEVVSNKYVLRDYQQAAVDAAVAFFRDKSAKFNAILVESTGCHAKGSGILMYDGTIKNVEDIVVGDIVMGDDGTPRNVLQLHRGTDEMFRITPVKGRPFVVNRGHILSLYKTREKGLESGRVTSRTEPRIDEISVNEYLGKKNHYRHLHKLRRSGLIDPWCERVLPIPPYMLGLLIGDGSISYSQKSITTMREEVVREINNYAQEIGATVRVYEKKTPNKAKSYFFRFKNNDGTNQYGRERTILSTWIDELGLHECVAGTKFIPYEYKTSSLEQRLELLAGLFDTDCHYDRRGRNMYEYCTKSKRLADDVFFLCHSVGLYSHISEKYVKGVCYYRITISGDLNIVPCRVGIRKAKERGQKKNVLVTGFSVESVGVGEYYGFTLDGNHLYLDEQFFVHHNSGKALMLAAIASQLDGNLLVFQPSKEILEQNYEKMRSFGVDCTIWSASMNRKVKSRITLATIGSVRNCKEVFSEYHYVLVDECHLVSSISGTYKDFIEAEDRKVLGLTGTPYRLTSVMGSGILKMLTRTRPRIFSKIIHITQTSELVERGYLAKLRYFDMQVVDTSHVYLNSTGRDYDERSLKSAYDAQNLNQHLYNMVLRLMHPKSGKPRTGILVFTRFRDESDYLVRALGYLGVSAAVVTADTPKKEREDVIRRFKCGEIQVVSNCNCLSVGFDFPALDTVVIARPTMSLALYTQMVGRCIRQHEGKDGWIVDLCGNISRFGRTDNLWVGYDPTANGYAVFGTIFDEQKKEWVRKQLTGIPLKGNSQRDFSAHYT